MDEKWDHQQMEKQIKEWKEKAKALQEQNQILTDKLSAVSSPNSVKKIAHSADFWINVKNGCVRSTGPYGTESIKTMIKTGKATVYDTDQVVSHRTFLSVAACCGAYDFAQFLINNGADIDAADDEGITPLDDARDCGYPHIEKLMLFAKMNVEAGNEIKDIVKKMQQQNGINECVSEELSDIGEQNKKLYDKTTMELMIRMISKRKTFSDNQLVYAMNMTMKENENILASKLWLQIRSTCSQIVQNGTDRDWMWLKLCLLPSMIWYKDISSKDNKEPHYLYYELLKLVNVEAMNQINNLDENLMKMAEKQKDDWLALTKWDIPNEYETARQDMIVNGIASRYTFDQLSTSSGTTFNSPQFYDYNQYLSQLVLLAQIVDEEFQESVQAIFGIDKVSNKGKVESVDDEKVESGLVQYMRGPIKLMDRARSKAQNDYAKEPYPASACVIDFNRCALIFDDISSLLRGLKLFVNKVKYYQSGNIIGIARDKNGFIEYVKEAQYADIKLNVIIKGKHNSIIGEVQFLLRAMKEYKDMAHNLYSIQRKEEAIKSSISATLPILLNQQKEIMEVACRGNVKKIYSLMITQNKEINDLMFVDKKSGNTILHNVCYLGHLKLFLFLESMMDDKEFIDHLFLGCNDNNMSPIDYAVKKSHASIVKYLFDKKEVQDRYKVKKNNDVMIFKLLIILFSMNSSPHITEYVLSALNISKERVIGMLSFTCPQTDGIGRYHQFKIMTSIIWDASFDHLQHFIDFVGEQAFVDNVFNRDKFGYDVAHWAFLRKKMNVIELLLSIDQIKKEYMSDNDLLHYLCGTLNKYIANKEAVKYVVDALGLTEAKLSELNEFRAIDITKILPFTK